MLHTITQHLIGSKGLCACVAALALTGTTLSASASPGHRNVIISGGVHVNHRDRCGQSGSGWGNPRVIVHGSSCSCSTCFAKHEYERGFNRGEAYGLNAGYRDGLAGNHFCADSRDELRDNSRFYRDGYFAAFGKAYHVGFDRGRAERARACRPSHGHGHVSVHVSGHGRW